MDYIDENTFDRSFSVESLFGLPELPESVEVFNYSSANITIPVKTDAFTIVLSRDVRRNAFLAAELAVKVALSDTESDVCYVNTYAGVNLMKEVFRKLFSDAQLAIRTRTAEEEEEARELAEKQNRKVPYYSRPQQERVGRWVKSDRGDRLVRLPLTPEEQAEENAILAAEDAEDANPFKGGALDGSLAVPNLRIYHVPIGTWDTENLTEDIQARGRKGCKQVIIINAFEYAPLTQGRKDRMARELLQLCDRLQLSVVVFSHEMKREIEAGFPGRGPIGILAAKAASVSRVVDPFEKFYDTRKQARKGVIHEKQIFAPTELEIS